MSNILVLLFSLIHMWPQACRPNFFSHVSGEMFFFLQTFATKAPSLLEKLTSTWSRKPLAWESRLFVRPSGEQRASAQLPHGHVTWCFVRARFPGEHLLNQSRCLGGFRPLSSLDLGWPSPLGRELSLRKFPEPLRVWLQRERGSKQRRQGGTHQE